MFGAMAGPDLGDLRASARTETPLGGRYRSLFVLGRGGMGSVEAALQTGAAHETLPHYERVVALKRLLPDAARDKRRVDMFLREARLATMLDHPNIVRAWDFGELDGELYLAMEFVEGQSLARLLHAVKDAGETLPVPVVAWLLAEICEGLHAAHELTDPTTKQPLSLVHRDVSPQNVIVGYDGRVKILDFGIAKIDTESTTKTGEVKGKTAYMSPEQAMGDPLDRRSDLFGVGALLFESLALKRMWGDGTDMEMIRKLALDRPPSLAATDRDVPAALTTLHARLVARSAKDRPETAHEVAEALRAFIDPGAAEAVRALVARHFTVAHREERERLSTALDDAAPSQADVLRASALPASPTAPSSIVPERPFSAGKLISRLVAVAALVGLFVYGYRAQIATVRLAAPVPRPVMSFPAPIVTELAPAPVAAPAVPAAMPSIVPSATAPPRPIVRAVPSVTTAHPSATATTTATAHPPPKPPDVDEHPF